MIYLNTALNAFNNKLCFPANEAELSKKSELMIQEASALKTAAIAAGIFAVILSLAFQGPFNFIFSAVIAGILVGCYDLYSISKIQKGISKADDQGSVSLDSKVCVMGSKYLYQDTILLEYLVANKK